MGKKTIVVVIAGASGSGKSSLARKLKQQLESTRSVSLLSEDAYYRQQSGLTFSQREETNYDHPDSIDEALLVKQLLEIKAGRSADVPVYDYSQHDRSEQTVVLEPCDLLVVEGILLLHRASVRAIADLSVFVDVPEEVCLERRIARDIEERGRTRDSVLGQYKKAVAPMFSKFVAPSMKHADLIVQNGPGQNDALEKMLRGLDLATEDLLRDETS